MAPEGDQRAHVRVPLSRERILDAGVRLADESGIESLTMRKLGEALGVEAMSLYYYVANKGEVVDAIVDLVVYRSITSCTVCYLCQSVYRGYPLNPGHKSFYLGTEERYKKQRIAWAKKVTGE